ncbi:SAM-dependent methyltransferase [Spongiivirga citrea]|uniref:SAM-dependent methyltransferase n=1 Tax=Spongiivirga citrea TaxID=1481457 RepID=A0A6M0CD73_9FLAO|nr:SAM-dependent methyltransferase [Spongiivirga citrea]NER15661.1 SAM-dependent methyltransferase [Spongiivirga citrea]
MKKGNLYLIPTRLGDNPPLEVLPMSIKRILEQVDYYIVENEKTARRFIKKVSPSKSQAALKISILNKFTNPEDLHGFLAPAHQGIDIGLLSEAGAPAIADPGADIVAIAHEQHIRVIPLVGPSSILMALMSSGMNGQSFAFNGYLPIDKAERHQAIKQLERRSKDFKQSQAFIETPYRNTKLFSALLNALSPHTKLCVATDITLPTEYIKTYPVSKWKQEQIDLHKRPTIFIIQA